MRTRFEVGAIARFAAMSARACASVTNQVSVSPAGRRYGSSGPKTFSPSTDSDAAARPTGSTLYLSTRTGARPRLVTATPMTASVNPCSASLAWLLGAPVRPTLLVTTDPRPAAPCTSVTRTRRPSSWCTAICHPSDSAATSRLSPAISTATSIDTSVDRRGPG
jgi:hypothetical protein